MGSLSEGKKLTQPDSGKDTPPDFRSLKEVPASYLSSEIDYNSFVNLIDSQAYVPVVDLADPNIIELVGRAFQTYGVFQVTNHGIHMGLIKDTEIEARRLFSLPADQKLKALHPPDGSAGYGLTRFTPFFDRLMWNEGFSIMGSPIDDASKLWPNNYTIFCDVIEGYLKQMQELSMKLKRLILASLGLTTEEDLKMAGLGPSGEFTEGCITALQLNHYPPCPNPKQVMGLAAHTDTSMFTILYQGDISGLQVYREGVGWATVPAVPGAFVVNAGDLLHILSNGRFPTLVHRVLANPAHNRISLAYFHGPTPNAQIKPFSNLVEPGDVPRYRSMLWGEYINTKAKHIGKALSLVSNIEQKQTQEGVVSMKRLLNGCYIL